MFAFLYIICEKNACIKVVQSCLTLSDSLDSVQSTEFSRQEYWSGQPFPSPGDLPNPGNKPGSSALQADSLPSESTGEEFSFLSGQLTSKLSSSMFLFFFPLTTGITY